MNQVTLSLSSIKDYLDLINEILQANYTAPSLDKAQQLSQTQKGGYTLDNRLLKKQGRLIVAESVYTSLIIIVYYRLTIVYLGKSKTQALVKRQYYQSGIDSNINQFISNYYTYYQSKVLQDKTLGFLYLLPILDYSQ